MKDFFKNGLEPLSYLIYAISIFIMLRRNKSVRREVLFVFYLIAIVIIWVACYTTNIKLNRLLYNVYFFLTVGVFSYYFKSLVIRRFKKYIVNILLVINLVVFINTAIISLQHFEINNYFYAITYLTIVIYTLLYFDDVLKNVSELKLLHQFDFWLVSGYLLYFLSCFFIIFFYENIDINLRATLWSLQNIILFLSSVLTISASIWIYRKKYY
jgi:hypothetical protein